MTRKEICIKAWENGELRQDIFGQLATHNFDDISTHALREEGDIRQWAGILSGKIFLPTPSARRAWVEIIGYGTTISVKSCPEASASGRCYRR